MAGGICWAVVSTKAVVLAFALELRITGLATLFDAAKEVLKRGADVLDGLLRRALSYLGHPGELGSLDAVQLLAQCCLARFATSLVFFLPLS